MSIQELLFPQTTCFGCGPSNPKGLQLRSYRHEDALFATFKPWPEHDNGAGFLNGGIMSTLLDCHSAAAVMDEASRQGWLPMPGAGLAYVTAGLNVRFLRPAPLQDRIELRAVLTTISEAEMICSIEVHFDGKQRATADATWRRWRPRPAPAAIADRIAKTVAP